MWLFHVLKVLMGWPGRIFYGITRIGRENIPKEGAALVCSNHVHLMDPFIHAFAQNRPFRSMAKAELFKNKLLGACIRVLGGFSVNRGKSDVGAMENAFEYLKKGEMLLLFPEGHRSTGDLLRYKPGIVLMAHKTGAPIVPAVIATKKAYRLFGPVRVIYGKPITTHELGVTTGDQQQMRQAADRLQDIAREMLDMAWA